MSDELYKECEVGAADLFTWAEGKAGPRTGPPCETEVGLAAVAVILLTIYGSGPDSLAGDRAFHHFDRVFHYKFH